jgi:hypothetical protein
MVWGLDMRFLGRKQGKINARAKTKAAVMWLVK